MVLNRLVVLYGIGGLSDVGRHTVRVALDCEDVGEVIVLTKYPHLLNESNWKCGCQSTHLFSEEEKKRLNVVSVESWDQDISPHFQGVTAVVSCLGNRQPFIGPSMISGGWEANVGNQAVIQALQSANTPHRVVVCSSIGIEEDWPPMEFFKPAKYIMSCLFMTVGKSSFRDLTEMERAYKKDTGIDYLFVRPVGLGEDVAPAGKWTLQREKHKDVVGIDMAKLDVARYLVQEALQPTLRRTSVVIGAVTNTAS